MTWEDAADLLELFLENAAQLADGEDPGELPELPGLDLSGEPDPETERRIRRLLLDTEEAMTTLGLRRAEIGQELSHMSNLRTAGAGYLRYNR